jgi:hypothetical protein
MGWSAFAAPLASGQLFTMAMKNELYAALQERNNALASPVTFDAGPNATILASTWPTDLLSVGGTLGSWATALRTVWGAGFIDPSQNGTVNWGTAPPDPLGSVDPTLIGNPWPDVRYWNAIRAGILSLGCIRIDLLADGYALVYTKTGLAGPYSTETLAATALVGASESSSNPGDAVASIFAFNPSSGSRKFTQCTRSAGTATFPAGSGGSVLLTLLGGSGNNCTPLLRLGFSGPTLQPNFPGPGAFVAETMAVSSGGIGEPWEICYDGYDTPSVAETDFANFAPTGGDGAGDYQAQATIYMAGGDETAVGFLPSFSYV